MQRLLDAAGACAAPAGATGTAARYGLGSLGAPMVGNEALAAMVEHHPALYADLADPLALLRTKAQGGAMAAYWPYAAYATAAGAGPRSAVAEYSALMTASQPMVAEAGAGRLSAAPPPLPAGRGRRRGDVVVDIDFSGISTGTEKLLWNGRMPPFPGMGYPLVPGYESVGRVVSRPGPRGHRVGEHVFVPGAAASASARPVRRRGARLVVPGARPRRSTKRWAKSACCWRWPPRPTTRSSAAAARPHRAARPDRRPRRAGPPAGAPDRGRRLAAAHGVGNQPRPRRGAWATRCCTPTRTRAATTTPSTTSAATPRSSTRLIARLAPGGEIVLAGFYSRAAVFNLRAGLHARSADPLRRRMAAPDLLAVKQLAETGRLSLDGLITHHAAAATPTRPTAPPSAIPTV
jgi:3-hydroxyethyl bacteriochlorophyllide a dehydrogenase